MQRRTKRLELALAERRLDDAPLPDRMGADDAGALDSVRVARSYIVAFREPQKGPRSATGVCEVNVVARSEAEALHIARRAHPRWQHIETRRFGS